MALDNIKRPPTQVGGDQIAIVSSSPYLIATINRLVWWEQTYRRALPKSRSPPDRPGCGCAGVSPDGWQNSRRRVVRASDPNVLIAADLREDLHATENGRGPIDKGRRSIERIRHDTVHPDMGMLGLERLQQAQGELFFRGIMGVGSWFGRPLFLGHLASRGPFPSYTMH